jgi:glycosyltransferase involved in cell wall biosynthesis
MSDRIIAISQQTCSDIQEFLGIEEEKIDVIYQGCDPVFYSVVEKSVKEKLKEKYSLPGNYLLSVGTIEPRKNLLKIVQALHLDSIDIPLLVIGRPTPYLEQVKRFIRENSVPNIQFLSNVPNEDLPGLYQMADIFLYPSKFEGFGIPILEALSSRTPVITSTGSCFAEAGGKSSLYVHPDEPEELAKSIRKILDDSSLRENMRRAGFEHAMRFTEDIIADNIMEVYMKAIR